MSEAPDTEPNHDGIPPHWKIYLLWMEVPRRTGTEKMVSTGKGISVATQPGRYEFGKIPAAGPLHAINEYWRVVSHMGPALLDIDGKIVLKAKLKKTQIRAEECAPDL